MRSYYYLAASLSPLEFPHTPRETFASLKESLSFNVHRKDKKKLESLRLFVDILNLKPLWDAEEIDPRGNLGEKELEESLVDLAFFPEYVFDFLEKHTTLETRTRYFPELLSRFFREEAARHEGFLRSFFSFEREWRLVVLAMRAKRMGRDLIEELQFEDPSDPFIRSISLQKDGPGYEPPSEYRDLKELLEETQEDPVEQNKRIARYRFQRVQEMDTGSLFSMDGILSYLAQLMIIEYWIELDSIKGEAILEALT